MYYLMKDKYARRIGTLPDIDMPYTVSKCNKCGGITVKYEAPISFDIQGELCDYYMFDNLCFISEKMLNVIRENGFTGYEIRDAVVRTWDTVKNEDDIKALKYFEMIITGRCGFIRNLSNEELAHCKKCGRKYAHTGVLTEGVSFDEKSYDGSDFFAFNNLTTIPIVSDKIKKIITNNKLVNVSFLPLNKMNIDDRVTANSVKKWLAEGSVDDELKSIWIKNGVIDNII